MLCALIMAGGKGTRFWPLSTEEKPKQFLNLIGEDTMIQMTVNRIKPIIPIERIFVCTGEMYVDLVKEQLSELPERNIIIEPEGRNTAPCIALSAFVIKKYYKDSTMVVLPSDHLIKDEEEFRNIVKTANEFVESNDNAIITLGMKPSRVETGYGYIKHGNYEVIQNNHKVIKVDAFVEKPNRGKAEEYISDGSYLWNGGMFLWSAENILKQIKAYSQDTYEALHEIEEVEDEKIQELINSRYSNTEAISIDYAVLEKSRDIYVIPSDFGWDDVGSWDSVERYGLKDEVGNICNTEVICINSKENLIINKNKNIVLVDIDNIFCIETDTTIFIGEKNKIKSLSSIREGVIM